MQITTIEIERFWSRVSSIRDQPDACALWTGGRREGYDYGYFWIGHQPRHERRKGRRGRLWRAHHIAWFLMHGEDPPPDKPQVLHHCDTPACVVHTFTGTNVDNMQDMVRKGRHGSHVHPEARPRGDQHWSRRMPERVARGERHRSRTSPETLARGAAHGMAKLTDADAREILAWLAAGVSCAEAGRRKGVTATAAWRLKHGKSWKHLQ